MKRSIGVVLSCYILVATGCSTHPDDIEAAYVSPTEYADYDCSQLRAELQRVNRRVMEVTGQQRDEAQGDSVAMGVGLVLFWPALFFLAGDDKEDELSRLKGQYNAIEEAAIKKKCDLADEIKQQREKRKEEASNEGATSNDNPTSNNPNAHSTPRPN